MKTYQYLNTICKNILNGKFDYRKYQSGKSYYGRNIQTQSLFCSYGTIGFTLSIEGIGEIQYDWEMKELTIDEKPYKYAINLEYLEDNDINLISENVWDDEPNSVELETYTDAGEDMIIDLTEPSKEKLDKYIDDFDINENVMMWWREGEDYAHSKGVPFDNIREHYEDYEDYIKWLKRVSKGMPY